MHVCNFGYAVKGASPFTAYSSTPFGTPLEPLLAAAASASIDNPLHAPPRSAQRSSSSCSSSDGSKCASGSPFSALKIVLLALCSLAVVAAVCSLAARQAAPGAPPRVPQLSSIEVIEYTDGTSVTHATYVLRGGAAGMRFQPALVASEPHARQNHQQQEQQRQQRRRQRQHHAGSDVHGATAAGAAHMHRRAVGAAHAAWHRLAASLSPPSASGSRSAAHGSRKLLTPRAVV